MLGHKVKVKIAHLCLTLCDPMDHTVHGILQARILEWVAFPFSRGIVPTQGSNPGLLHCGRILYQLSYEGSLGHKASLKTFQRTEIIQTMFSNYKGIKLETNNRKKTRKSPNVWKVSDTFLNRL